MTDLSSNVQSGLSLEDLALLHQSKIIQDVANKGSCVIVGRCIDYVLKNNPNVLKVFIYAEIENRKKRIEHVYNKTSDAFLEEIKTTDSTWY